jgi:hypothetical protein
MAARFAAERPFPGPPLAVEVMINQTGPSSNDLTAAEMPMRKLSVFNNITLDGYLTGPNGDMSWAHEGGGMKANAADERTEQ